MAIFGEFTEFDLREVIALVGRRTGKLRLRDTKDYPKMDVHIQEGKIRGLTVGDQLIDSPLEVRDCLSRIATGNKGVFEFTKTEIPELRGDLFQAGGQLLESLSDEQDEIQTLRMNFPHRHTRFVLTGQSDPTMEHNLGDFVDRARRYLDTGIDSEELGSNLGLSLEQVQLRLYKLRLKNIVAPVRAGWSPPPPPPPPVRTATPYGQNPKPAYIHRAVPQAKRIRISEVSTAQTVRQTTLIRHTVERINQKGATVASEDVVVEYPDHVPQAPAPFAPTPPAEDPIKPNRTGMIQKMLFALYPRRWK